MLLTKKADKCFKSHVGCSTPQGMYRVRLEVSDEAGGQFACGVGAFNVLNTSRRSLLGEVNKADTIALQDP